MLRAEPHPLLDAAAFTSTFAEPIRPSPGWLTALLALEIDAPVRRSEELRQAVRRLLRQAGYKPTGRGKPSSEYLLRAVGQGSLESINVPVDACNAVSLASGLPISVIDLDRARAPFRIALAPPGARAVFNASGQEIDLSGLLCLWDAEGPCANAVKDAQRTKTTDATRRTLSVVWSTREAPAGHLAQTLAWYRELVERAGAATEEVAVGTS